MAKMPPTESISCLLNHHARTRPGQLAYSTPHRSITFASLATRTYCLASHLAHYAGAEPIAIILPRCIEFVETILAITRVSCIGVPLDLRASVADIRWALRDCGAHVVFTDAGGLDKVCEALKDIAGVMVVAVDASQDDLSQRRAVEVVRYEDWAQTKLSRQIDEPPLCLDSLGLDEPAYLHYTSGTTGTPKGVLSSQRAWLISATNYAEALGITATDKLFWPLPLFHAFGHSMCIIGSLVVGTTVYLTDHGENVLASVLACEAVTIIAGVPSTYHELATELALAKRKGETIKLPRPRICIAAGGATPVSVKSSTESMFGVSLLNNYGSTEACGPIAITGPPASCVGVDEIFDVPLLNRYGCTESCGAIVADRPGDVYQDRSCGAPLPHMELQITQADTTSGTFKPVADGIEGEIWIRGPSLMLKYWKSTQGQEAPFTNEAWYRTDDLGRRLPGSRGHIVVTGRLNELIRRGSETINPAEVETILRSCPGIEDVVVTGFPHDVLGETLVAYVVRAPQCAEIDPILLLSRCRAALPDFKVPTMFFEIETLPRTSAGKLKRRAALDCPGRPLYARLDLKQDAILALVLSEVRGACGLGSEEIVDVHVPFVELGMHSLAGVVLCDRLASLTGVEGLSATLVYDNPTPLAMSDYLYRRLLDQTSDPSKNMPSQGSSGQTPTTAPNADDQSHDPIAIISMACRYPGSISSPDDLWDVVASGTDVTSCFPTDRGWDLGALSNSDGSDIKPGTCVTNRGGFLTNMADFDTVPFRMSPREALATDPQQRLLLETAWHLFESARMAPSALHGSNTGVFLGVMYSDYAGRFLQGDAHGLDSHLGLGSAGSVAAGRISYTFGLNGPSMAIDTACSSSIVAIDLAAKSLRSGECTLAIAGGVTVMATPRPFVMFSRQGGLAPDGRCKSYSAEANGTAWSEGVGLLMLERLSNAQKNGHQVLGLIRGSAVNSDGASNGLTAPSAAAQEGVIRQALVNAKLDPGEVDVLEGHGTATTLGDAIEIQAVTAAYGHAKRESPLLLGSIKSNIGHTQAAAGVAGIIKMVQAMKYGIVPRSLHVDKPSPYIANSSRIALALEEKPWAERSKIRPPRAAVSSFGIGGTNSHIILEGYAEDTSQCATRNHLGPAEDIALATYPWLLSGANEAAMRAQAKALLDHNRQWRGTAKDIAFSLATTRSALSHRAAILSRGGGTEIALHSLAHDLEHPDIVSGMVLGKAPGLVYMFSGQASLRNHSTRDIQNLCACFPAFDAVFHEICQAMDPRLSIPLSKAIYLDFQDLVKRTDLCQAIIFALEVALFRLLESFGIQPNAVVGHSVGEIAAAHCAGYLSFEGAASLIVVRGKLMAALPSQEGAMASISASEENVRNAIANLCGNEGACSIAAVNATESVIVSGSVETVSTIMGVFASRGHTVTLLKGVNHAFHSPWMNPVPEELFQSLSKDCTLLSPPNNPTNITLVSTVTGHVVDPSQMASPKYWAEQVCAPVRFADAVQALSMTGSSVFLEIGPSAPLSTHVPNAIATHGSVDTILEALAHLWVRGTQMEWDVIFKSSGARAVDLPMYQFQRSRYWLDPPRQTVGIPKEYGAYNGAMMLSHPILADIASVPGDLDTFICQGYLSLDSLPWLADHGIGNQCIMPATVLADLALVAGRQCLQTTPALEELVMAKPLILTAGDCLIINVIVNLGTLRGGSNSDVPHTVDIYSRPHNADIKRAWMHHATGNINRYRAPSLSVIREPVVVWQPIDMDIGGAYAALGETGMHYGPTFRCVRSIWRSQDGSLLRARLQLLDGLTTSSSTSLFSIHPALLDAALHAGALVAAAANSTAGRKPRLPFILKGVQILRSLGRDASIFVKVPNREYMDPDGKFSVTLEDQAGDVIAVIAEVMTRPWKAISRAADLFRMEWTPLVPETVESTTTRTSTQDAPNEVVHTWDVLIQPPNWSIPDRVHAATAHTLDIIQQWSVGVHFASGGRLIIVTEKATVPDPDLTSAAIWGLVRSAQAEFDPEQLVLIDLDGMRDSLTALPRALASRKRLLAVRNGVIMAPSLSKYETRSSMNSTITIPAPINTSGTVLITGGTGALGARLARHLVQTYKAKALCLLSRAGPHAPDVGTLLTDLSSSGVTVEVLACDVTDRLQVSAIFSRIHPPVTTIIHTAGVLDDSILSTQTSRRISNVLQPKVNGAWLLHEIAPPEAQLFLFSSAAGLLGNPGQAGYAAANCFLDGLASYRRARGLHGLSLAWGPWENERGMAGGTLHDGILVALSDEQALDAFDAAVRLRGEEAFIIPMLLRGRSVNSLPLLKARQRPTLTTSGSKADGQRLWKEKLGPSNSQKDRAVVLHGLIETEVALVLGYQPEDPLPNRSFIELGMDSFTAVQLRNRLSVLSGLKGLPPTLAFDANSLPVLVDDLLARLDQDADQRLKENTLAIDTSQCEGGEASAEDQLQVCHDLEPSTLIHTQAQLYRLTGLASLFKCVYQAGQYNAAAHIVAAASLTLPRFSPSTHPVRQTPRRLSFGSDRKLTAVVIPDFTPTVPEDVSRYAHLAPAMGSDYNVYELQHPTSLVPDSLEALAEVHAGTIRELFHGVAVVLVGFSAGGCVAHAVAHRLLSQETECVVGLILIDTYALVSKDNLPDWLLRLALPAASITIATDSPEEDAHLAMIGAYLRIIDGWRPEALPRRLRTLFIRATEAPPGSDVDWYPAEWPLADKVEEVLGHHIGLLDRQNVAIVAARIRDWIAE